VHVNISIQCFRPAPRKLAVLRAVLNAYRRYCALPHAPGIRRRSGPLRLSTAAVPILPFEPKANSRDIERRLNLRLPAERTRDCNPRAKASEIFKPGLEQS